jgi:hypothetical protein
MAILGIVTFGRAQDATSTSRDVSRAYKTGELLQTYSGISAPLPDPQNFLSSSWTRDKAGLRLALRLVKRPDLNKRQQRIILDALSLSSSEFFAASGEIPAKKAKADDALQALRRRALAVFPKNEVADLFAKSAVGKAEHDILRLYYDMSALPLKERKTSFRNVSSNDKSELWRTHLALFLVKRPELDEWQKEIILAAISFATPEHFDVLPSNPAWKAMVRVPLRSLEEQIVAAFSFEDGAKIFATLGDDTEAAKHTPSFSASVLLNSISYKQLSDSGPYKEQTNQFGQYDKFVGRGPCECSTASDWCPISGYCSGTNCSPTQSGCGTLWSYQCDGACR